jgi:hypothetical protein
MSTALAQSHDTRLWERPAAARKTELRQVARRVLNIEVRAVDRHEPAPAAPRAGCTGHCQRDSHAPEQHPQRLGTEPSTSLGDRRCRRDHPAVTPRSHQTQRSHQASHHFLVAVSEEQGQRHRVIDHDARRQETYALLLPAALRENLVHQISRNQTGEHADGDSISQATIQTHLLLYLPRAWHVLSLEHPATKLVVLIRGWYRRTGSRRRGDGPPGRLGGRQTVRRLQRRTAVRRVVGERQ